MSIDYVNITDIEFPKLELKLKFLIGSDKESGIISLAENIDKMAKDVQWTYIDTRDKAIRAELIKMGWTPPEEKLDVSKP